MPESGLNYKKPLVALSRLLLTPQEQGQSRIAAPSREEFLRLAEAASSNHVIVRGLEKCRNLMLAAGEKECAGWAEEELAREHLRIEQALRGLDEVCRGLRAEGFEVIVVKSLDHWPDIGSDLDMFTSASADQIGEAMTRLFQAKMEARSWGDRLAGKWNFQVPGLKESIEIHVRRLGQTGEQLPIAESIPGRARTITVGSYTFQVTCPTDRIMISTLQRMYRHFFFRLCDIVDTRELSDSGAINYEDLHRRANAAGIWEGVAAYLQIVSDYLERYGAAGLPLPDFVKAAATISGNQTYLGKGFIRVPILPQSARLYTKQLTGLLRNWEIESGARLSLLPWLAAAAAVKQKITGSDKGIW